MDGEAGPPRVEPGFLGVGWESGDERPLSRGGRCPKCGRVAGERSVAPRGVFCLACLGFHPADEARARHWGHEEPPRGNRSPRPSKRLNREDRRSLKSTVHGAVFLATLDAEKRGDRDLAARLRLWTGMHQSGELSGADLALLASREGVWDPSGGGCKCVECRAPCGPEEVSCPECGGVVAPAEDLADHPRRKRKR